MEIEAPVRPATPAAAPRRALPASLLPRRPAAATRAAQLSREADSAVQRHVNAAIRAALAPQPG